ncbi:MAG TPA: glutathione S-transferase family protein [Burkholderiales bacterium]|nr:glutathione S-transferase family protein [Burkholderiales bacterium]
MGYLLNGQWHDGWYDTKQTGGAFERPDAQLRNRVTADGSSGFPAEFGRYHLYVSLACPWAHRTLIFRKLKKLEDAVTVSVVEPVMTKEGWGFSDACPDTLNGFRYLHEAYTRNDAGYSGRVTVPVLWDKQRGVIVNNESSEIIRMLDSEFASFAPGTPDYYPAEHRAEIDAINAKVYANVNNGVYRAGFAGTQAAYEAAASRLFEALDELDARLARSRWLVGRTQTEADWRLFTTLVRFDAVYYGHFKCNVRRVADYPHLFPYLLDLYQTPGVADTVDLGHIKRHYYMSHEHINPTRIVPIGPDLDFTRPHGRERLG